jgi:hypothetical protein
MEPKRFSQKILSTISSTNTILLSSKSISEEEGRSIGTESKRKQMVSINCNRDE